MSATDCGPYCSLCLSPQPDAPAQTLAHVQREHFDAEEFRQFVSEIVVRNLCAKCGTGFWSDVEALSETTFGARPYCTECRKQNRPLRNLLVDHMDARELVARGLLRPELAEKSRSLKEDNDDG